MSIQQDQVGREKAAGSGPRQWATEVQGRRMQFARDALAMHLRARCLRPRARTAPEAEEPEGDEYRERHHRAVDLPALVPCQYGLINGKAPS
jgi:hypothetical protein